MKNISKVHIYQWGMQYLPASWMMWCQHIFTWQWASCQIRKIARCVCAGNVGNFFPPPRVCDPGMHHGTCMMHVQRCMLGLLTRGFLWSWWRKKCFWHSQRMHKPQFNVSGKKPMDYNPYITRITQGYKESNYFEAWHSRPYYDWICRGMIFYPSALRAGGVLSSRSGRAGGRPGGRLPNLRNPYLCNRLMDFLHSKFCRIV